MSIDPRFAVKTYPDRIETDNKIELENGDYAAKIHDVWIYYVDIDGRYTKDAAQATEQRIKFTVVLDDTNPVIALKDDLPIRIGKKTVYSSRILDLTGIGDPAEQAKYDPKNLVGSEVLATIHFEMKTSKKTGEQYEWSEIKSMRPREAQIKKPKPAARPAAIAAPEPDWNDLDQEIPF